MTPFIGKHRYFKKAYVINLATRQDRYQQFDSMIKSFNAGEITRYNAIRNRADGALGCAQSHLGIIRQAKQLGLPNVLIFEDDAMFADNIEEILQPAINQLTKFKWDFFYLGGRLIAPAKKVSPNLAKMIGAYTTHAYAVSESMYDKILAYDHNKWKAIDVYYSLITRDFNSYICYPIAVHQRPSVSDLIGAHMDYRQLMQWSYDDNIKP